MAMTPAEIAELIRVRSQKEILRPLAGWKWVLVPEDAPIMVQKGKAA